MTDDLEFAMWGEAPPLADADPPEMDGGEEPDPEVMALREQVAELEEERDEFERQRERWHRLWHESRLARDESQIRRLVEEREAFGEFALWALGATGSGNLLAARRILAESLAGRPLPVAADDPRPEPSTDVDRVIDALDKRMVPPGDRSRLRDAVDRADAPLGGRAGADEGLGRAVGRRSAMGVRTP